MHECAIGLIGLAVMGENLALNLANHEYRTAVYNRTTARMTHFTEGRGRRDNIYGCATLPELVGALSRPRILLMMVRSGTPVDDLTGQLLPLLEPGDILIDGGNAHFRDTQRRAAQVAAQGILYVGAGISGGEEGALNGPSIMPGGAAEAWPHIQPILQSIAAVAEGQPCCDWIGPDGAGHYVKMVHNGIEYADMQIISEAYHVLKTLGGLDNDALHAVFDSWNRGPLESYLVEITRNILGFREPDGTATLDVILDAAAQKGTGQWTATEALASGSPATLITEAVFARYLSADTDGRTAASSELTGPGAVPENDTDALIRDVHDAVFAAKILAYAQGFALLQTASQTHTWDLAYGSIARMWRGGCIIRSVFLNRIAEAYDRNPAQASLLLDPYFREQIEKAQTGWRRVVAACAQNGIPVPAFSSALSFYDGYRSGRLPANLIQAQRDYFGAHTYERTDRPRGTFFHTDWTGEGGDTTSGSYSV